jgi:energy-coupling factor transport system ATP-binding protein
MPAFQSVPAFIHLQGVRYSYPHRLEATLPQIDLEVRTGEYVLISGASGSGKSTLCRTFNGLIPHFHGGRLEGSVQVAGRSTSHLTVTDLFDQVALVAQNPQAQLFNRTVFQELAFGLESLGMDRERMAERIHQLAEQLDLTALLGLNPQMLSGGQQQLVTIAAALVLEPRVVALDEPLANLDPAHVRRLSTILRRWRTRGTGIVVCEHRLAATLADADRLVVLDQGRKCLDGHPEHILRPDIWETDLGVELPLAVEIGHKLNLDPLPRRMADLPSILPMPDDGAWQPPALPPQTGLPVLRAERVGYTVGPNTIVHDIDLELYPGSCVALVGANGAGKTTLLKLLAGLLRPDKGRIWIKGRELRKLPTWEVAAEIGTAFQNPNNQFFKLNVREELEVGPRILDRYDPEWMAELIRLFELESLLNRSPFKLSGGEKKRVAFAAALAARPAVLALDEPTAGQDGRFRQALAETIQGLCRRGTAVLIITHALDFAEKVAALWWVMAHGMLIARGTPHEIMAQNAVMERAGLEPTERYVWWHRYKINA